MMMTKTRIHGRFATVPRRHAAAGAGGHGLRCRLRRRLPWTPRACRSARHRHGLGRAPGDACRRRSEAVRRRLRRRPTARGPARRLGRHLRERHPPRPGGGHGHHGVHGGGGADANRHRFDRPVHLDARRSPPNHSAPPTVPRRRFGRRDASREPPTHHRCGRTSLGSCRWVRRRDDRRGPRWAAARRGHPRGVLVPGHRGGRDDADGLDGRRPSRHRPRLRLREIRRSRCGVRQTARQRGPAALHRVGAADGRRRVGVVVGHHRGVAVDRHRGGVAVARTVRSRHHPYDVGVRRGPRVQPTGRRAWPLWRSVPLLAAEWGVARAEIRQNHSLLVQPRDHPRSRSVVAAATLVAAAAWPAAPAVAAAGERLDGRAHWQALRRGIRRAKPKGRGSRGPT